MIGKLFQCILLRIGIHRLIDRNRCYYMRGIHQQGIQRLEAKNYYSFIKFFLNIITRLALRSSVTSRALAISIATTYTIIQTGKWSTNITARDLNEIEIVNKKRKIYFCSKIFHYMFDMRLHCSQFRKRSCRWVSKRLSFDMRVKSHRCIQNL